MVLVGLIRTRMKKYVLAVSVAATAEPSTVRVV